MGAPPRDRESISATWAYPEPAPDATGRTLSLVPVTETEDRTGSDVSRPAYEELLSQLETGENVRSRLAPALRRADRARARNLRTFMAGARLRGLNELVEHLDTVRRTFTENTSASPLSFLIARAAADYETALEATLSGYNSVAADAMRDVMEIELLLLDFTRDPSQLQRWLGASLDEIRRHFSPGVVRRRLHAARVAPFTESSVSIDYKAHSIALHVGSHTLFLAEKGLSGEGPFLNDIGFIEMMEHGRRLVMAIEGCWTSLVGGDLPFAPIDSLENFRQAWERTQEMQGMIMAIYGASLQLPDGAKNNIDKLEADAPE
jgi:hypothetical protein